MTVRQKKHRIFKLIVMCFIKRWIISLFSFSAHFPTRSQNIYSTAQTLQRADVRAVFRMVKESKQSAKWFQTKFVFMTPAHWGFDEVALKGQGWLSFSFQVFPDHIPHCTHDFSHVPSLHTHPHSVRVTPWCLTMSSWEYSDSYML